MIPYANLDDANTGVNIVNKKDRYDIYMKNCCVSLVSAKCHNDCDVALVTNTVVAEKYRILLEENNIKIIQFPFDHFLFEHNYTTMTLIALVDRKQHWQKSRIDS